MIPVRSSTGMNRDLVLPASSIDSFDHSNSHQQFERMPLFTLHKDGVIKSANDAGSELLGCEFSNNIWLPISKFIPQLKGVVDFPQYRRHFSMSDLLLFKLNGA